MLSRISEFRDNKTYYLPILLIISFISHFPFVLKGFGEIDATKIAVTVIDLINYGDNAAFANYYFADVVPLYILYLIWFMKLLNHNYSYLPLVMNYTNAVFGIMIIVPAFFLIRQLFHSKTIAFCTVLALIFAPSFYQSTIMGFPHLIAFFFLLVSLCFYLSGIDHNQKSKVYLLMLFSCVFLTIAFLFKSDYVLAAGTYIGLLFMRKIRAKGKIIGTFFIILTSGVFFLLFRDLILGPGSGTTMSRAGMSKWYEYSLIIPNNLDYLLRQSKPIAYGAGLVTFCMGITSFLFYLFKRKFDMLVFILSWAAGPILFWLVMIGNNARHNMFTTLPLLALITVFLHERSPKYVTALTVVLILGNFFITSPSYSILTPSGNLFKSNSLLEDRMNKFRSSAKDIAVIDEDKIVVLGFFHNPHIVFEIMSTAPSYEAVKIGRENYRVLSGRKEYVFIYFVVKEENLKEEINYILKEYNLYNYLFVSATYDLNSLNNSGIKTKQISLIERSSL